MTRITLPNGNRLAHGQLITKGNAMKIDARNGAAKRLTNPAITHGMVRQSKPSHEFLHGAPAETDDSKLQKNWEGKGNVPTHPGMVTSPKSNAGDRLRGTHNPQEGNAILREAGRLSRK